MHRKRFGQHAEPADRLYAFKHADRTAGNAGAAHSVRAITAGDEIACDLIIGVAAPVRYARLCAGEIVYCDVFGLEHNPPISRKTQFVEIAGNLGLSVHDYACAGQPFQIDAETVIAETDAEAIVKQRIAAQTR